MPRMPVRERREQLIEAAIRVIAEKGVGAATTRAIVAEADMPLASFHYVFESHAELMAEASRRIVNAELSAQLASQMSDADGEPTVEDLLNLFISTLEAPEQRASAILQLTHYSLQTDGQRHLAEDRWRLSVEAVEKLFAMYAERNHIRWTTPVTALAQMIVTFTDGLALNYAINRDTTAMRAMVPIMAAAIRSAAEPA